MTVADGRAVLTLPAAAVAGMGVVAAREHLLGRGLDVELVVVDDDQARSLRHVRSDLHETTFVAQPAAAVSDAGDAASAHRCGWHERRAAHGDRLGRGAAGALRADRDRGTAMNAYLVQFPRR